MEAVLQGLATETCMVYLDDTIVLRKKYEEHLLNIDKVFKRLEAANLKLSPKKCKLFKKEEAYLGHIISAEGVQTDPEKTETVRMWPAPKDLTQLRSFLGLCTYYRRFIPGFFNIASPLHRLTESGRPFVWTPDCQRAMEKLKEMLTQVIQELVASSHKCREAPKKELLILARPYLSLNETTVLLEKSWWLSSSKLKCEIDEVEEQHWTGQALRKSQREDRDLLPMINWIESDERPSWEDVAPYSPKTKSLWSLWKSLTLRDGAYTGNGRARMASMNSGSWCYPDLMYLWLSRRCIAFPLEVTSASEKHWPKLEKDYFGRKGPKTRSKGKLKIYYAPFERIAIDVAGPFTKGDLENKYILVIMDYFTKWPVAVPNARPRGFN
ncbi:K02A2.6-like [Cordylochernes scorpioides]|uniref:K02A2.6-like n=1 Tax=Cordylochernes scorpioides TaxID=51811 RepID=A0ABY6KT86_9ARAC|nr:K02A2.6-like [Cordylochernes scorpioides]